MPINFPDSPAENDSFTSGGKKWIFNGTVWTLVTANSYTIPTGEVTAAKIASNAVTEAKINDGAVTQSKLASGLSGITVTTTANRSAVIPSPFNGQFIFLTDTSQLQRWDGSAWVVAITTVPTGAPTSVAVSGSPTTSTVTLTFTPGGDGGSTITNYQYALSTNSGSTYGSYTALSPADGSSPITITGLASGVSYYLKLKAVNALGTGSVESSAVSFATADLPIEYLIVAGGGSGGARHGGGGGGGGYISGSRTLTSSTYAIVVGGGGTEVTGNGVAGNTGSNSTFGGETANGGGGGGVYGDGGNTNGKAGGSGGGAGYATTAGASNQPAGITGTAYGFAGGTVAAGVVSGGGGGAGAVGGTASSTGGTGGAGRLWVDSLYYAGGGGGGSWDSGNGGNGGIGGGGGGNKSANSGGTAGTGGGSARSTGGTGSIVNNNGVIARAGSGGANTGGGGGGGEQSGYQTWVGYSGNGGSGVVIVRYLTADAAGNTITGGTATTSGTYTFRAFTSSGNLVVS